MKHTHAVYMAGTILMIVGVIMNILHVPYAHSTLLITLVGMTVFQATEIARLERKIKEQEKEKQ